MSEDRPVKAAPAADAGSDGAAAQGQTTGYDVFLSHNGDDKDAVLEIARRLRDAGVEPFLDSWHLVPGEPWQEALEKALDESRSCAVFVGPAGFGPWETEEMRVALSRRVANVEYRVIPVLLPGATKPEQKKLPRFLSRVTWVDFRPGLDDAAAFDRLVSGIRGLAPETGADDAEGEKRDDIACPFRGLEVFDEEHAEFFFGREALTKELVEQLRGDRFLAVLGPSGSGKSSVVRAGLVPSLRRGDLPGSAKWRIEIMRPGDSPMDALATRLVGVAASTGDALGAKTTILDTLERDERGLHSITQLAVGAGSSDDRVVIVIDQFEEIFTQLDDDAARTKFVATLLHATSVAGGGTVVVITMRADFFGKCAAIPGLAARMSARDVLVPPMDETELRQAMILPAEKVGLQFEKGLVDTIMADLGNEPGSLPLLQHTLLELFDGRRGRWLTIDRYVAIGRVKGAIAQRAEAVFNKLTPPQQAAARRILLRLTQPGEGTDDTRRRASIAELVPTGEAGAAMEAVVNELAEARLVTTSQDESGDEIVDVAHEALIRGWPRLQGWVDENPAALRVHRELTLAAENWDHHGRKRGYLLEGARLDETSAFAKRNPDDLVPLERSFLTASRRRRQIWVGGVITLLVAVSVVFAGLGLYSFAQRGEAVRSAAVATTQSLLSQSLAVQREHPAMALRLAIEALVRANNLNGANNETIDLKSFTTQASDQLLSGRYVFLPALIQDAFTDPEGRILIGGASEEAPTVFDAVTGKEITKLSEPIETIEFPGVSGSGIFVVTYAKGEREIRRVSDGSVVPVPARIKAVAVDPGPDGATIVVSYGESGDTTQRPPELAGTAELASFVAQTEAPSADAVKAQILSAIDGSVLRDLAGPADLSLDFEAPLDVAGVLYRNGGVEVVRLSDGMGIGSVPRLTGEMTISPDGKAFLLSAGSGGHCGLWAVAPLRTIAEVDSCEGGEFSRDGSAAALFSSSEALIYTSTRPKPTRIAGTWTVAGFGPGPAPRFVALSSGAATGLFPVAGGEPIVSFEKGLESIDPEGQSIALFSPDESLVMLSLEGSKRLISTSTGEVIASGEPGSQLGDEEFVPASGLSSVDWSSDGKWFIEWFEETGEVRRVSAPKESTGYVTSGTFWPGSDGALLVSEGGGLSRITNNGVEELTPEGASMTVMEYAPGDHPGSVLVVFYAGLGPVPTPAILTMDGVPHALGGSATSGSFSGDAANGYVVLDSREGRSTLWERSTTKPVELTTFPGLLLTTWDPNGRWLQTTSPTGDAYLVDLSFLKRMGESGHSLDVDWLEEQTCNGPARQLVDDAMLASVLKEAPESCK